MLLHVMNRVHLQLGGMRVTTRSAGLAISDRYPALPTSTYLYCLINDTCSSSSLDLGQRTIRVTGLLKVFL